MALNKPSIILRRMPETGQIVMPICWDDVWYMMPLFGVAVRDSHICLWRRGWRRVAAMLKEQTGDAA